MELLNLNWIKNHRDINSTPLLEEFILLFIALSEVELSQQKDDIRWRWIADGQYTMTSTYDYQFQGAIRQPQIEAIWRAVTEPKCKFFVWLAMHDRVLTANNMLKKNWSCEYNWSLHETTEHLLIQCNYTEAVWNLVAAFFQLPSYGHLLSELRPCDWVQSFLSLGTKKEKEINLRILFTF
jgi:hypothetical protein